MKQKSRKDSKIYIEKSNKEEKREQGNVSELKFDDSSMESVMIEEVKDRILHNVKNHEVTIREE